MPCDQGSLFFFFYYFFFLLFTMLLFGVTLSTISNLHDAFGATALCSSCCYALARDQCHATRLAS